MCLVLWNLWPTIHPTRTTFATTFPNCCSSSRLINCIRCSHHEILRYIKMLIYCWRWHFAHLFSVMWLLCRRYGRFLSTSTRSTVESTALRPHGRSTRSRLGRLGRFRRRNRSRFCSQCVRGLRNHLAQPYPQVKIANNRYCCSSIEMSGLLKSLAAHELIGLVPKDHQ